jgi:hypothetical protein
MVHWMQIQLPGLQITLNPHIACYPNGKNKASHVNILDLSAQQKEAAQAGATLSISKPGWPASRPTVGLVCSPLSSAVDYSAGRNNWHTVAMARDGNTIWVHDPDYYSANYTEYENQRVISVHGNKMVKELINQWPGVEGVWYQGPPPTFAQGQGECQGRSAQWVEHTLNGSNPWPPNTPGTGGEWHFHRKN